MDAPIRVEMLGRFALQQGSREITRFRTQKTASLLACLARHRSRVHPRDVLIEMFWPESELKAARTNLSVAINALRRQLEPPGVPARAVLIADHVQLHLNPITFGTDVEDFENTIRSAELETEPSNRLTLWMTAVGMYRGDLLPGFYDDWVLTERDHLRDAYLAALQHTVKGCVESHWQDRAIEYARRLVQADPLREESHRLLMRLLVTAGRPYDALRQYQELERILQTTFHAMPSSASRELAAQLTHIPPEPRKTLRGLASSTLSPEINVLPRTSAPDRKQPAFQIPLQFTRFFGREEEMARLEELLGSPERSCQSGTDPRSSKTERSCPLVTLTGPGGTGKTRLSIELAGRVREAFPGGIWFVPLADVDDPLRLGETLRDILELPRQSHPGALDQVIAFLNDLEGPVLLILDNFEQITAGGAPVVWTLLNRVSLLRCLVTSRQPLSLPGGREVPVLPLPVSADRHGRADSCRTAETPSPPPDASELMAIPSTALLVDRAQAARPEFQLTPRNAETIAALCEKLEGIPLAIELAAARADALTASQILERLTQRFELLVSRNADRPDRHRSLWAAIEWSYDLLPPDLQRLYARLSVFRGGWTAEAAQEVCAERMTDRQAVDNTDNDTIEDRTSRIENSEVLECLAQLRRHSLILPEESSEGIRFRMLETLREFADEQLTEEERKNIQRRHAACFHRWVTGAQLTGNEQAPWYQRFEEDIDNLRAVLAWSLQEGNEIERGHDTARALVVFWRASGRLSEGRRWYARLLERSGQAPPSRGLGRSLYGAGALASLAGDFQAAHPLLERCREVAVEMGDENCLAVAQNELGSMAYRQGDFGRARLHYAEYLALARKQGTRDREASALNNLANVAQAVGDFAASRTLNEASLEIRREAGDQIGVARTLHSLGNLALAEKQLIEARACFEQSVEIRRGLNDRTGTGSSLLGIALVAQEQRDYPTAAAYARESLALVRDQDMRMNLVEILYLLTEVTRAAGALAIAARMYGALEKVREEINYPMQPVGRDEYDQIQAALRESLSTGIYDAEKKKGRKLSLEQALVCVEQTLASKSL